MKNRITLYILLLAIAQQLFTACDADYLNREPSDYLTGEQIGRYAPLNPEIARGLIRGIYSNTFAWGTGGTGDHDDFGQKSIDIVTDMMAGDMVLTGKTYGWFSPDYELNAMNSTDSRAHKIWRYYYQIIHGSNLVVDAFANADSITGENRASLGQAMALRAYAYFYLVNLYQHPYADNQTALVLPVYVSQNEAVAAPLSSVDSVYRLITSDLERALLLLDGFQRTNKNEINSDVAKGLLTYAYLHMGKYSEAAALATEIIAAGTYPLMNKDQVIESGFNNVLIPGWMWGVDLTINNTPGLPTFWGMMDIYTYSYAGAGDGKAIDIDLYNAIPESDIRKQQFLNDANNAYYLHPNNKFYDAGRTIFGDRQWENDIVYMRVAEMYLIAAEAMLHIDTNEAKKILRMLLSERETGASTRINGLTDEQLKQEIHLQWRIECWGEGKSLLALKRFKGTVQRGSNHRALANTTYPYNDARMVFEIPENELNNNPQITVEDITIQPSKTSQMRAVP